ncbi:DUF5615 family PIN-like protein [Spirulina sp. 06S082]|uniref:DUF5615 family PIN-like protein n=1 Tax=Spirulina sp. 06S082 TaxID=3110248 RepID=UPI002B1EB612|nr:DUF5615 family PIN-like protein [Spirulina sp. 06S082]MEA5472398.1 DUF5615 family PIN-like protein [Spirulina sp. 06S082]
MQFLADENFPRISINHLRGLGYDVASCSEDAPQAADEEVLARAIREERFLLTFDRDYGELIYRLGFPSPIGVIYFRDRPQNPAESAERLCNTIDRGIDFTGMFTVLELEKVRQRPLP